MKVKTVVLTAQRLVELDMSNILNREEKTEGKEYTDKVTATIVNRDDIPGLFGGIKILVKDTAIDKEILLPDDVVSIIDGGQRYAVIKKQVQELHDVEIPVILLTHPTSLSTQDFIARVNLHRKYTVQQQASGTDIIEKINEHLMRVGKPLLDTRTASGERAKRQAMFVKCLCLLFVDAPSASGWVKRAFTTDWYKELDNMSDKSFKVTVELIDWLHGELINESLMGVALLNLKQRFFLENDWINKSKRMNYKDLVVAPDTQALIAKIRSLASTGHSSAIIVRTYWDKNYII